MARHGETADNVGGLILGHRDPPLSEVGRGQAEALALEAAVAGVVALWSSPLLRARETSAVIAAGIGVEPTILDDLIESDRGDWEGRPFSELIAAFPEQFDAFEAGDPRFAFPGGESIADQVVRTRRALDLVASGPQPSLVVAHAGTIRAALIAVGGSAPPERALPNGDMIDIEWPAGPGA
jgi:probable phosphoglycerate mutase